MARIMLAALWLIFFLLSIPVGLTALGAGTGLLALPYELYVIKLRIPWLFACHSLASGLALMLMPAVFAATGRTLHKYLGRITAALVLAGGLAALPVAFFSVASPAARAGFFAQGLVWLAFDGLAYLAIRQGNAGRHRVLMFGMAAVASGAIWLRLTTVAVAAFRLPFVPAYATAAWACWLIPLMAAPLIAKRAGVATSPSL
jgi:Predicted membrane protein (DUF2306)